MSFKWSYVILNLTIMGAVLCFGTLAPATTKLNGDLPAPHNVGEKTSPPSLQRMYMVGKANYNKGPFKLYTATLCTSDGHYTENTKTFAIHLQYKRSFSSAQLIRASLTEMSRLSNTNRIQFVPLRSRLKPCFPSVKKGDEITGLSVSNDRSLFYVNGKLACDIVWPNFRHDFFGIWLDDRARSLSQSRKIRGFGE